MVYTQPDSFTINIIGECQFSADDKRQLSPASRIGFFGCWLVFEKSSTAKEEAAEHSFWTKLQASLRSPSYFIFKSSLSAKQYARLCRIIMTLSHSSQANSR